MMVRLSWSELVAVPSNQLLAICACATGQHIDAYVQAYCPCMPDGLLVLHMPANTGVAAEVPLKQPYDPLANVLKFVDSAATSGVTLPDALNSDAGGSVVALT